MSKVTQVVEVSSRRPLFPDLAEAWHHRGLAMVLMQRNIKLRYAQTILGAIWVIIQPLLLTGTLSLVLGAMLSLPSDGSPYVLFAFSGTVLWTLFQRVVSETSISMAASGSLILKVYFPRVLVPVSGTLTVFVDILPSYLLLVMVVAWYGMLPGWPLLLSPLFLLIVLALALALGFWITMLDAIFRDMRMIVPTVLQLMFFLTPVMYAESAVPAKWELLYRLNPLVGLLHAFRWSTVAGVSPPIISEIAWCTAITVALLAGSLVVFARLEQYAVDRI
jgi:lipopolysaccharide transport system permease protein